MRSECAECAECAECEYARAESDPYATGDTWYTEYYCTLAKCICVESEIDLESED